MRQTLFYIPHEFFDLPGLPGGWLLILYLLVCAAFLAWQIRRHGWGPQTRSYLPTLVIFGLIIAFVLPRVEMAVTDRAEQGLPIRGYGVMLLVAIVAGVWLAAHRARQVGVDPEMIMSLAVWLVVGGIVGARLFYVIQKWDQFARYTEGGGLDLARTLAELANVAQGGLVVYGSFLGAVVAAAVFFALHRLPPLQIADVVAPSLMVGLAIGRLGCLLNGCCFGAVCYDDAWSLRFPGKPKESPPYIWQHQRGLLHGFRIDEAQDGLPVVTHVIPGSQAEAQGLKPGDRIFAINGNSIKSFDEAEAALVRSGPAIRLRTAEGQALQWSQQSLPPKSLPVYPTQIYSAINAGLLAAVLWSFFPFRTRWGQVLALLLTLYPITRFVLEVIRTDEAGLFGTPLTISQWVSIVLLLCGAGLWLYLWHQPCAELRDGS